MNDFIFCLLIAPFFFGAIQQSPQDKELENEIQRATEQLHQQIQQARQEIEFRNQNVPIGEFHVILAPLRRTILSAQISTPILSSQVSAPVTAIRKRLGESFKTGDILIELDTTVFFANLEKAFAILARAQASLTAKEQLFKDRIASYLDLKEAQALKATAIAELMLAQNQYDSATIFAPYNGRVITLLIEEFELPQPGQGLIEVEQDDILLAKMLIPSTYYEHVAIGQILPISVKETGTTVDAKIIRIGSVIDPSSSTLAIEAEIMNPDRTLRAGMTGTTHLTSKSKTEPTPPPQTEMPPTIQPELQPETQQEPSPVTQPEAT